MANDAFALSPISARATQPSEEDYDAISEAFMETARGRWFLGEYAKRNRNADTRMVLDAVARIEQSLAAQKQPEPEPVPDTSLADALAAIKAALNEAKASASHAIDSLAPEQHLAPVRKGTRVIREISWRWREIGADSRICDLIDSQISAIEASCAQIAAADPHIALSAAFDLIGESIAAFDETPEQTAAEAAAPPSPAASPVASDERPATATEQARTPSEDAETIAGVALPAEENVAATPTADEAHVVTTESIASEVAADAVADPAPATADMTTEAADAHDEAVLDMIAAEMAAPDDSDEEVDPAAAEMQFAGAQDSGMQRSDPVAEPEVIAPAEAIAVAAPEIVPAIESPVLSSPQPDPEPEPSLGSTLLANGFLRRPATAASDPLAPLRRLSQIEKIALFS